MRINLTSVLVDDQAKALRFYTDVLGFVKKTDIPVGEAPLAHRGLRGGPRRPRAAARARRAPRGGAVQGGAGRATASRSLRSPSTMSRREHERLTGLGVRFTQAPTEMGPVTTAVFDDTCGNLIQIAGG